MKFTLGIEGNEGIVVVRESEKGVRTNSLEVLERAKGLFGLGY